MPTVTPSNRFDKAVAKLPEHKADEALEALEQFVANPSHPGLNFEKVKGTKSNYTIRTNGGDRICLRKTSKGHYDVADMGDHDYIYRTYG
jgi:hypothetical protein